MTFPRLHLFEFEDQPWLPGIVRDLATDYLCFIQATFRLHRPIVPLVAEALRVTNQQQIVDLCSGGGGPVLEIQKALSAAGLSISITLTDRFPNPHAFQKIEEAAEKQITSGESLQASIGVPNKGSRGEKIVSERESDDRARLIDVVCQRRGKAGERPQNSELVIGAPAYGRPAVV